MTDDFFFGFVVDALRRWDVERRRQVGHNRVEQGLHALVLERRAAEDRIEGARQDRLTQALLDHFHRRLFAAEIGFHRLVVELDGVLDHVVARLFGLRPHVVRDLFVVEVCAETVIVPDNRLHANEVDQALEAGFGADRQLDRHGLRAQTVADRFHALFEVGADLIHLVDKHDPRNVVAVSLTPDGFGLRLNALVAVQHRDGAVEDAQAALDFNGEVHVAGGVDDVEAMALPESGRRGGRNRDAAFLLLLHPVHRRSAIVHFADLVALAGVIQDPLSRRRLTGVDVSHDAEVTVVCEFVRAGHGARSVIGALGPRCGSVSAQDAGGLAQTARARKRRRKNLAKDAMRPTSDSGRKRGSPRPSCGCLRASSPRFRDC